MKSIRTMTRTLTAALLIAAMTVPAAAATKDVGLAKAKEAALKHAGVSENQTLFLVAEADVEDGRKEYEVEFVVGEKEYDYTIDAASGGCSGSTATWSGTPPRTMPATAGRRSSASRRPSKSL